MCCQEHWEEDLYIPTTPLQSPALHEVVKSAKEAGCGGRNGAESEQYGVAMECGGKIPTSQGERLAALALLSLFQDLVPGPDVGPERPCLPLPWQLSVCLSA